MTRLTPERIASVQSFDAKLSDIINQMCDPTSPNFARSIVEVRAGLDVFRKHAVQHLSSLLDEVNLLNNKAASLAYVWRKLDVSPAPSRETFQQLKNIAEKTLAGTRFDRWPDPQPIETAPKGIYEAPRILLFESDKWVGGRWLYGSWCLDETGRHSLVEFGPTHWLPMPPNPS